MDTFIGKGKDGSRLDSIEGICRFLQEEKSGFCKVIGSWKVGKTSVIEMALRELDEDESRFKVFREDDYVDLGVEVVERLVASRARRTSSRFLTHLKAAIQNSAFGMKVVVFRISVERLGESHNYIKELCRPDDDDVPKVRRQLRKFVFELHEEIDPGWQGVVASGMVRIHKFKEDEALELLRQSLRALLGLDQAGREEIVKKVTCRQVGYHPELLKRLCDTLCAYGQKFVEERLEGVDFESALEKLVRDCFNGASGKSWEGAVDKIFSSLSADALQTIWHPSDDFHTDVYSAGLVYEDAGTKELALLVRRFCPAEGPRVFISYSREDSEFVDRLREDLVRNRFNPWVDRYEVIPGESIPQRVFAEIAKSDFFVVVLSASSVQSPWVNDELDNAIMACNSSGGKRTALVPALKERVEIPARLLARAAVDFSEDYADGLRLLVRAFSPKAGLTGIV